MHKLEKNKNAQLAREVEVALPVEFSRERQIEIVREYVKTNFVDVGMCADWSIHDKGTGNPHAHILLTTRGIKPDGKWAAKEKKTYALDENGDRIPLIDKKTGEQKTGRRNEKLWKRITVQADGWNGKTKAEEWRTGGTGRRTGNCGTLISICGLRQRKYRRPNGQKPRRNTARNQNCIRQS